MCEYPRLAKPRLGLSSDRCSAAHRVIMSPEAQDESRWTILLPCMFAMLAVANLQYAWTLFTTDLTRTFHARLDAVQWTLTFFTIAQTALFPIKSYLIYLFG